MPKKYLIFDSGGIINVVINDLLEVFRELRDEFNGSFLITNAVKYETVDHPLQIKKFMWGAIRVEQLINDEIIKLAEKEKMIDVKELEEKTREVMNLANNCFLSEGKPIHLIEKGESECLALAMMLNKNGVDNCVVIDERTARMICENPENLRRLMEEKLRVKIKINEENLAEFSKVKVLRSTELIYLAYKKGLFDGNKKTLEAILYALKYNGCSISEKEVQTMKRM